MANECPKCQTNNPKKSKFCMECATQLKLTHSGTVTLSTPAKDPRIGETVSGKYKLLEKLGSGGMGIVYRAEQIKPVKRSVALKIIKLGMDTNQVVARFETERQALAVMDHPNIAKVFDGGATETGRPFFVMELVRGIPITEFCDKHKLSTKERLELFIQVCRAVQHAHQKGVIHRDLKPSNILVMIQENEAVPKIIDFGIAKATEHSLTERTLFTEQGQLIGTPEYMSPEQAEMSGLDVDTRTDIYSLGVILYELLVGALPFDQNTLRKAGLVEIQRLIRETDPPKASTRFSDLGDIQISVAEHRRSDPNSLIRELKGDLDWITVKTMAKDRTLRYASASELGADINNYLNSEPVTAGRPSLPYRIRKYMRRHKVGVAATFVVTFAIFVGITGIGLGLVRAKQAEKKARKEAHTAKEVSDFLVNIFKVSDPSETRGNTITAREILDKGADKIRTELSDQEEVQARIMRTLGLVYGQLGLYSRAEILIKESLEIRRRILGNDHLDTLDSVQGYGALAFYKGNLEEAEIYFREALNGYRQKLGDDHTLTLKMINNIGVVLWQQQRIVEAEPFIREGAETRRRIDGIRNRGTLISVVNYATLLWSLDKLEEAEINAREAVMVGQEILGKDDPLVLGFMNNFADILLDLQKIDEADKYFSEVFYKRKKILNEDHPDTLESMAALGHFRMEQGRFDEAEIYLNEALKGQIRIIGKEHYNTHLTMESVGLLNRELGKLEEAEEMFRECIEVQRRILSPKNQLIASSLVNLGEILNLQKRYKESEPILKEALTIYETSSISRKKLTNFAKCVYGECLKGLQQYEESEHFLLEGYKGTFNYPYSSEKSKKRAIERLIDLYTLWGKPDMASEFQEQLNNLIQQ